MNETKVFKSCPSCMKVWRNRDDFLADEYLLLNGYQSNMGKLEYGLFLFTHFVEECNSTMAIKVGDFRDLYQGEIYTERRTGSEDCRGYCIDENNLDRCDAKCECAYVRDIIQFIKGF